MIVGNGLIASGFKDFNHEDYIIFASGVSDSNEINADEFKREENTLLYYLSQFPDKKIIYFNSILALEDIESYYFLHKRKMVNLIFQNTQNYKIYNIPQIFGPIGNPKNIVNLFIDHLKKDQLIIIQPDTFRSIVDIDDLAKIVIKTLDSNKKVINLAYIEYITVKRIMEIISEVYGIKPRWFETVPGISINTKNDILIHETIEELGINRVNYTERTIRKYVK